ncbi:hypothetical protein [Amphiplicatus metriothermophilus]|uniref:hypothetical protein n=1 Tax=Amphiplicatus metriothermophilus TaxID=1519374 RepID=UPI000B790FED|nr:hypothetical protein [Amphiplicatus metriothermophilus]MBB5518241.1 hypothetical protein [Amphiplicatus metriothermophilus]
MALIHDRFEGGATRFTRAGARWRGRLGDALVFRNVLADGRPDPAGWHAGEPVTRGWKGIASLWLRARPFAGYVQPDGPASPGAAETL